MSGAQKEKYDGGDRSRGRSGENEDKSRKRKRVVNGETQSDLDDYYNVNINWSTLDPKTTQRLIDFIFRDYMAIKCQEQIISHLITNDITVWSEENTAVVMDPDYDHEFQLYYKDFVKNACVANWVYGVVPVVLVPTKTGNYVPVVPELGTYILQVAYIAETEEHIFRTVRPQEFCARPQDLQDRDKYHLDSSDSQFTMAADKLMNMLNRNRGTGGLNLEGNPNAYSYSRTPGSASTGYYIDRLISIFNIFKTKTGPRGEIRSPLVGILDQVSVAGYALDFQQRLQYNMLHPMILVQPEKEQNIDGGQVDIGGSPSDPRNHQSVMGGDEGQRGDPRRMMSRAFDDIGAPLPPFSSLSAPDRAYAMHNNLELDKNPFGDMRSNDPGDQGYPGMASKRQAYREYVGVMNQESDKRLRFCPKGFTFSSSYKTPDVPPYYFEARKHLDETICGAFNVPIGLVHTKGQGGGHQNTVEMLLYMFQRSITDKATEIQRFLTIFLRESLLAHTSQVRFLSMKPMAPDFAKIDEENARVGDGAGGYKSQSASLFDMSGGEVPEFRGTVSSVPLNDPRELMGLIKGDEKGGQGNGIWRKDEMDERKKAVENEKAGLYAKTLAEEANEGIRERIYDNHHTEEAKRDPKAESEELVKERTAEQRSSEKITNNVPEEDDTHGLNLKSPSERQRRLKIQADINGYRNLKGDKRTKRDGSYDWFTRIQVRLSPLVYSQSLTIAAQLVTSGAYSAEAYQTALCQIGGIPDPVNPAGIEGAKKNQDYWYIVSGEKAKEDAKIREEERAFKREVELTKLKAKLAKEQALEIAKTKTIDGSGGSTTSTSNSSKPTSQSRVTSKDESKSENKTSNQKSSGGGLKSKSSETITSAQNSKLTKIDTGATLSSGKKKEHVIETKSGKDGKSGEKRTSIDK